MQQYFIKFGNQTRPASEYQNRIFDEIENGTKSIIINACAGSAKTTTIVNACDLIDSDKKVAFIAFNRDIVKEIDNKIKRSNVVVTTYHSLGYKILLENDFIVNLDENKYIVYANNFVKDNSKFFNLLKKKNERSAYLRNVHNLVNYSRYYLKYGKREVKEISEQFGLELIGDEVEMVLGVLAWGKNEYSTLDYMDLIWFPNIHNLSTIKYQFDWIFIDEAQDTSIAQQKLIEKCFRKNTRFVAVGDDSQQINVWCGASKNAIMELEQLRDTVTLDLPISYRCPKKVVELAKAYSKNIIAADGAIDGEIRNSVDVNSPNGSDLVLCRMTAPLIELHIKYHSNNKRSVIRGMEDFKSKYLEMLTDFHDDTLIDKSFLTSNGLMPCLYKKLFVEIDKIKEMYSVDDEDAISHASIITMYDHICGIQALSAGVSTVGALVRKINEVFSDLGEGDNGDYISLMTVHKSKGLEADNVYILCPSLLPSPLAKTKDEIVAERNLCYVAYTRAKKTLNFMEESRFASLDGKRFKPEHIIADIKRKRGEIMVDIPVAKNKKTPKKRLELLNIPDNSATSNVANKKRTTTKAGMKFRNFLE
jgi:superfamily I DNA/RNA helicase